MGLRDLRQPLRCCRRSNNTLPSDPGAWKPYFNQGTSDRHTTPTTMLQWAGDIRGTSPIRPTSALRGGPDREKLGSGTVVVLDTRCLQSVAASAVAYALRGPAAGGSAPPFMGARRRVREASLSSPPRARLVKVERRARPPRRRPALHRPRPAAPWAHSLGFLLLADSPPARSSARRWSRSIKARARFSSCSACNSSTATRREGK